MTDAAFWESLRLSRAAWTDDPRLNAFFASADDIPAFLGRSKPLRECAIPPAEALGDAIGR